MMTAEGRTYGISEHGGQIRHIMDRRPFARCGRYVTCLTSDSHASRHSWPVCKDCMRVEESR